MILVFGSLNADFFLPVQTFPLPGETILTPQALIKAGGKGANQAESEDTTKNLNVQDF